MKIAQIFVAGEVGGYVGVAGVTLGADLLGRVRERGEPGFIKG
jgi:hypothetical protein